MDHDDWQRERTDFGSAFEPGARLSHGHSVVTMVVEPVAEIELPTGELLVGDAGARSAHRLARRVAPGRYPVELSFARFDDGSTYRAAARIVFAAATPARWAPGWQTGASTGDPATLAAAVVRSGVAFFVDVGREPELRGLLAQPGDLTPVLGPGVFFQVPEDEGDLGLPCWWALDDGDRPLELAVDFRQLLRRHFEHATCPLPADGARLGHALLESHGLGYLARRLPDDGLELAGRFDGRLDLELVDAKGAPLPGSKQRQGDAVTMRWPDARHATGVQLRWFAGLRPLERVSD